MKDLLQFIVTSLVTKPASVLIDEQKDNGNVNLNLTVDPSDMGLIIGKNGQTIRAIRKLLTVRAVAENIRVNLQLTEPQGESRVLPAHSSLSDEAQASEPKAGRQGESQESSEVLSS